MIARATGLRSPLLDFSQQAALLFGVFLIGIETWRRWHQLGDLSMWPVIFDDYLAGAFLIWASFVARRSAANGRAWLAGAWGAATGMMFGSFFGQLFVHHESDPSGVAVSTVVAVKGIMFAVCVAGLVSALASPPLSPPARS